MDTLHPIQVKDAAANMKLATTVKISTMMNSIMITHLDLPGDFVLETAAAEDVLWKA